jgi:hypothetical protein
MSVGAARQLALGELFLMVVAIQPICLWSIKILPGYECKRGFLLISREILVIQFLTRARLHNMFSPVFCLPTKEREVAIGLHFYMNGMLGGDRPLLFRVGVFQETSAKDLLLTHIKK